MFGQLRLAYDIAQARVGQESETWHHWLVHLSDKCAVTATPRANVFPDRDNYAPSFPKIRFNDVACQPWVFCHLF